MPKLDLIGIVVKDMAASLAFYRLLGMAVPAEMDAEGHVEFVTDGGLRIAWDTLEVIMSFSEHWTEPVGHRMGLAFLCDSPAEVDRVYAELIAAGYPGVREPWDAFWGQRYAQVSDPDGNSVDLFARIG
ncbi:MAG TPA: VOC family protein [Anaerolineales bacterium]|nr:VOC family protein [Anaerolineales bacterium]